MVGLLHVGLIWALIAGLASGLIQKLPEELVAEVVKPKDEVKPPPPPPPDMEKPPPPFVPPPEINIAADTPVTNAIVAVQATVAAPPPVVQPTISPSKAVGRTHDCATYYPDLSRRLNESGDVLIHYDVGIDGAISNVGVSKSSGSERLDNAAVSCVSSRWRNTPAMQGTQPVASPGHQAIVRFSLTGH
ncbi:MAG: energy transducer TonB [Rhizomicrobium sp.]